jgi:transposase
MSKCTTLSFIGQTVFCGFDVHKATWAVCVRHCGREIACFSAPANARDVAKKLQKDYPDAEIHSVYEAGFSGFEAHRVLTEFGIHNIVVNPADIPTNNKERERKSDRIDCRKLARSLEAGLLEPIYVPSREHLLLRNIVRRETQISGATSRTINQLKSHWHFNGDPVPQGVGKALLALRYEQARSRGDHATTSLIDQLRQLVEQRKKAMALERETIRELGLSEKLKHLASVPGIGSRSAVVILSELWDMSRFPDRNHLASYVGLAPHLVGSGAKEKTVSGGNRKQKQLHYILIQAAWSAARHDPEMTSLFGRLHRRRLSPKRIVCIIAKKLLFIIRAVLLENRDYQSILPGGYPPPGKAGTG